MHDELDHRTTVSCSDKKTLSQKVTQNTVKIFYKDSHKFSVVRSFVYLIAIKSMLILYGFKNFNMC